MAPAKLPAYADIEPLPSYRQSEADVADAHAHASVQDNGPISRGDIYDEDGEQAFYHGLESVPQIFGSYPRSARAPALGVVQEDSEDDDEHDAVEQEDESPPYEGRAIRDSLEIQRASVRAEAGRERGASEMEDLRKRVEEIRIESEQQSRRPRWREDLTRRRKEGTLAMWILALKIWHHGKTVKSVEYYAIRETAEEDKRQARVSEHAERTIDWEIERSRMDRVHRYPRYTNAYMEYQQYVRSGHAELDRRVYGFQRSTRPSESEAERRLRKKQEREDAERDASSREAGRLRFLERRIARDNRNRIKETQTVPKRARKREQCVHWRTKLESLKAAETERGQVKKAKRESRKEARREAVRELKQEVVRELRLKEQVWRRKESERLKRAKDKRVKKERENQAKRERREETTRQWAADEPERRLRAERARGRVPGSHDSNSLSMTPAVVTMIL